MTRIEKGSIARRDILRAIGAGTAGVALAPLIQSTASAQVAGPAAQLRNGDVHLSWRHTPAGWALDDLAVREGEIWHRGLEPAGRYSVLTAAGTTAPTVEDVRRARAGTHTEFLPSEVRQSSDGLTFRSDRPDGTLVAHWRFDPRYPGDVLVTVTWTPRNEGWYSIPSPTLGTLADANLGWGVVPGWWSASTIETDEFSTFRYALGVPTAPVLSKEASTTSLTGVLQSAGAGITIATTADPSLARDPWPVSSSEQSRWNVGVSLRDLPGSLSPTVFFPVLGQAGSRLTAGQPVTATYRYTLGTQDWYDVTKHVTRDVYDLDAYLDLARNTRSLVDRITTTHDFLLTPASRWHTWTYEGRELGAESGKLSDVGAMWMLTAITADPALKAERLPYARNFKLGQQQTTPGPFQGAALGEYFRDGWISEVAWANLPFGDYVSPMFTTFYTLADLGNVALFEPGDTEVRDRIRMGAEKLLSWQHPDGSFDLGYRRDDPSVVQYPELEDLRATWYGFLAAYRILGDQRYLAAARKGADWFLEHAVAKGKFLGVCDDARLIRDFAVIFAAQALLDLHENTGDKRYQAAAIECAKFYTQQIFDHPTPTDVPNTFEGREIEDWQVSQAGLAYEHAGLNGSVVSTGPILLSSHAGAFVRFHELTGDRHFLDLARAAARGRDAWIDRASGISSYYWYAGSGQSGVFPWHGWWHIGWITDYLLAEAHLRSGGRIAFPRGFCTAKVGSHGPYGFADGTVYGERATFYRPRTLVEVDDPEIEVLTATSPDKSRLFVIALNHSRRRRLATLTLNPRGVRAGQRATWHGWRARTGRATATGDGIWSLDVAAEGLTVLSIDLSLAEDPEGPELRRIDIAGAATQPVVTWSYWGTTTAWLRWRVRGTEDWTETAPGEGYRFDVPLELGAVPDDTYVEVQVATRRPDGGTVWSETREWRVLRAVVPDGPNLARGRPVEVSSTYTPVYTGPKAVDGNTTALESRWLSSVEDKEPTIAISLPAVTTPRLVRVYTPAGAGAVVTFGVEVRNGSGAWQRVGGVENNSATLIDVRLDPVTGDQVRLVITKKSRDPVDVSRIYEVEVYDQVRYV